MKRALYKDVRELMQPVDVLAFGGSGVVSGVIKTVTGSNVSHVGSVLQTMVPMLNGVFINQVIESIGNGKKGKTGVVINRISDLINDYDGDIWWLPLSNVARSVIDQGSYFNYMLSHKGKKYDLPQALGSAVDIIPDNKEDLDKLFCSELVTTGLEQQKVFSSQLVSMAMKAAGYPIDINASEMTPADVAGFPIYKDVYQLKGDSKELS